MTTARESLAQSGVVFKGFMATEASTEEGKALQAATEKSYTQWYSDLEHQATWLESNQLSDFLTAPVQASQDAFDANVTTWRQDINRVLETASEQGKDNYHRSAIIFYHDGGRRSVVNHRGAVLVTQNDCSAAGDYRQPF